MAVSDDIQHLIIEMDEINNLMELFWIAFQYGTSITLEHAVTCLYVLRKKVDVVEEQLQTILLAVEKMEDGIDLEYEA
jgi:hypothetical protein